MKITFTLALTAALTMAGTANAQDGPQVDTATGTLSDVNVVGGIGPETTQYLSASWTENLTIKLADGNSITVTKQCVGMGQPEGSLFDRHVSCNGQSGESSGSLVLGCDIETDDGLEMSCVGFLQGKTGEIKDHAALETAYYKFGAESGGTVQGSSHWIR